ncbi:unnamed protein product [Candida verbasci]|uniref:Transcription elongation factor n=1 Tax=Candida verbasci TaxID=1227364 RepID=A0A9W4XAY0_9ASCO|nr:unnamed protein product [Candida verbasci]
MDTKEIKSIVSNLEKTQDDQTMLKLLNILNDDVIPTEKLLRETKVGVAVNKFRSHDNSEINQLVKKMIRNWRDAVKKDSLKKKQEANKDNSSDGNKSPDQSQDNTSKQPEAPKRHYTGPRTSKSDAINTQLYENPTRNASVGALYTALAVERDDSSKLILSIAVEIESEVFKAQYGKVDDTYRTKLRTFTMNLKNKKNPEIRERLLSKSIKPNEFINMKPTEMAPEALRKEMEQLHKQNLFDAQGATEKRAVTDRFTCGKCKHKKVSYYQMQTRSADEPLTTFCTCENCGNRWKFS